jgi:hypothetical protein
MAPKSVRQASTAAKLNENEQSQQAKKQKQQQQQQQEEVPSIIPAGQKCGHGKWQPEPVETLRAKKWTCYECTFVCSKCGQNSVGLCDSYDCS